MQPLRKVHSTPNASQPTDWEPMTYRGWDSSYRSTSSPTPSPLLYTIPSWVFLFSLFWQSLPWSGIFRLLKHNWFFSWLDCLHFILFFCLFWDVVLVWLLFFHSSFYSCSCVVIIFLFQINILISFSLLASCSLLRDQNAQSIHNPSK